MKYFQICVIILLIFGCQESIENKKNSPRDNGAKVALLSEFNDKAERTRFFTFQTSHIKDELGFRYVLDSVYVHDELKMVKTSNGTELKFITVLRTLDHRSKLKLKEFVDGTDAYNSIRHFELIRTSQIEIKGVKNKIYQYSSVQSKENTNGFEEELFLHSKYGILYSVYPESDSSTERIVSFSNLPQKTLDSIVVLVKDEY